MSELGIVYDLEDDEQYQKVKDWWNFTKAEPQKWNTLTESQKRYVYAMHINDPWNTPAARDRIRQERIAELGS